MRYKTTLCLLSTLLLLSGCSLETKPEQSRETTPAQEETAERPQSQTVSPEDREKQGMEFAYFYRGFTPRFQEDPPLPEKLLQPFLIGNAEDWNDFTQNFCTTAGFLQAPDFAEKQLIVICSPYGSRAGENCSAQVESVQVKDGVILVTENISQTDVYAISRSGVGHLFINVLAVDKADLQETVKNVYHAGDAGITQTEEGEKAMEAEKKDELEIKCPKEYMQWSADVDYGELVKTTYYSTTCEKERPVNILLPAGYDENREYPVLYLLHGIFGSQNDMVGSEKSGNRVTIGNMIAKGAAQEMIVVFPYMYASKTQDACTAIDAKNTEAYDNFVNDLRDDLMPFLKANYSVKEGRENTAIAGFSMGGRESLAIALQMQDAIGYVGAIAPAPGLVPGKDWAMEHPGQFAEEELTFDREYPIVFMICCGDSDKTVGKFPKSYHEIFEKNGQEHIWWEIPGSDHGEPAISSGIYNFCSRIFR